jgi:hypothetical protein
MPPAVKGFLFLGREKIKIKFFGSQSTRGRMLDVRQLLASGTETWRQAARVCESPPSLERNQLMALKKADFRTFYRDAHAVECLTEREKMLIGLSVAMMRLCDP